MVMAQLTTSIHRFALEWDPQDFEISQVPQAFTEDLSDSDAFMDTIFNKHYNTCLPVYVPSTSKTYLAISLHGQAFVKYNSMNVETFSIRTKTF